MVEFTLSEKQFNEDNIAWNGNRFLIGNGYFGIRGTLEEYKKEQMCAINMAGIYDRAGDSWRESVNAPNPLYTYVAVDGKKYALPQDKPLSHIQRLDFRNGIHSRETVWQLDKGTIKVKCERFASMNRKHLIAMKCTFSASFDCTAEITTGIDGDVWDINGPHFVRMLKGSDKNINYIIGITGEKNTAVNVREAMNCGFETTTNISESGIYRKIPFTANADEEYTIEKIIQITTSCDDDDVNDDIESIAYEELKAEHVKAWAKIWDISQISIDGDDDAMYALNYSIYHLNCIAPEGIHGKSIPARGLSGQVYKGAVFWDTEMFMLDYYIYTQPQIAKTLLKYRIETLEGARQKAREYGLKGAYYAWESQEGGYEGCSNYNVTDVFTNRPMRTYFRDKQYHVSAAVVYGLIKYLKGTGDYDILNEGALEMVIECARFYRSILVRYADRECYEIHDVVGPDEYHERVNNNAYTNRMAKFVFETALELLEKSESYPGLSDKIDKEYNLKKTKEMLLDSSDHIFIREPDKDGVIEQFDGYFGLEDTDIDEVRSRLIDPKEYWGGAYGVAAGTQIIKQADVAAMLSIFRDDYGISTCKKNFDYYQPRTEHGSSLSACMYSLLACRIGYTKEAHSLFMKSAQTDLLPGGKLWIGGIYIGGTHPASQGGAWIVAIKGFAGIEERNGKLICNPSLPQGWKSMRFKLIYCNDVYTVEIEQGVGTIRLIKGV